MRQDDNDNLLWKQRKGWAVTVMIMSGYAKTCKAVNTPDTLDWLITEPCFPKKSKYEKPESRLHLTSVRGNMQTSRCWIAGRPTGWGKKTLRADVGQSQCSYIWTFDRHVIPYEPPKCIGMLCNESVKTSACLALPDALKSFWIIEIKNLTQSSVYL